MEIHLGLLIPKLIQIRSLFFCWTQNNIYETFVECNQIVSGPHLYLFFFFFSFLQTIEVNGDQQLFDYPFVKDIFLSALSHQ